MDLLRLATSGSVDDGKSTLIGRLLYDTKSIYEDQLRLLEATSARRAHAGIDLSLLTDGLRAERDQGITIDVAYRYFSTPKRKFVLADTPGHVQYTRNMVTGASNADAILLLIDARKGVVEQTKRHALLASLMRVRHAVVCINKMDLVDYAEEVFNAIRTDFAALSESLGFADISYVPMSALNGDNIVTLSSTSLGTTGRRCSSSSKASTRAKPKRRTPRVFSFKSCSDQACVRGVISGSSPRGFFAKAMKSSRCRRD